MKKMILLIGILTISISVFTRELLGTLQNLPGVVEVQEIETSGHFQEKYLIWFEQYLDKNNPEAGTFKQRVFLNHRNIYSPVVYITEGYSADYASRKTHIHEITDIVRGNQICVEHRFFGKSVPEPLQWEYLTAENAAYDLHRIREVFRDIYQSNWLSTGTSKGGQNAVIYRMLFPEDVSLTVAYVAPFARALIDGRHEPFIERISSRKDRRTVRNFQRELLDRKESLMPIFKEIVESSGYTFSLPLEDIFDYCVLEYSFAFWQWLGDTERIPDRNADDNQLIMHLIAVSSPEYFSKEGISPILPFFYQAAKELGYYGYDIKPFEKTIGIESSENYFNEIFLASKFNIDFNDNLINQLEKFIKTEAENIIFIYGEFDPWTAVAADIGKNDKITKIISPRGTHSVRIKNMPKKYHDQLIKELRNWAGF